MSRKLNILACCLLVGCAGSDGAVQAQQRFELTEITRFEEPWALEFLPDGRLLVSEMRGVLKLYDPDRDVLGEITGVPEVSHGG